MTNPSFLFPCNGITFRSILSLVFTLQFTFHALGQDNKAIYNLHDAVIGDQNLAIYNGILYKEEYANTELVNVFYKNLNFFVGNLNYDQQSYYGQKLKLDTYNDQLLITPKNSANALLLVLDKSKVYWFTLDQETFYNADNLTESPKVTGYIKLLAKGDKGWVFKKSRKLRIIYRKDKKEALKYILKESFWVFKDNILIEVKGKQDLRDLYPLKKDLINQYFKENRLLYKNNKDQFYSRLFNLDINS